MIPSLSFEFPQGKPGVKTLGDILDDDVPGKYYMADMWYGRITPMTNKNFVFGLALNDGKVHQHYEVCHLKSIVPCLAATEYKAPRMVFLGE